MTVHTTYFAALEHNLDVLDGGPGSDALVAAVVPQAREFDHDDPVDRNLRALAPPKELRDAYQSVQQAGRRDDAVDDADAIAWRTVSFEDRYREFLDAPKFDSILSRLRKRERDDGELWLVCYEKDPAFCHRRVLADVLCRGRDAEPVHHPEPDVADAGDRLPDAQLSNYQQSESPSP